VLPKIGIVTDSTADIPDDLVQELGITVVPLKVIFDDHEVLRDGVDIQREEFYDRLQKAKTLPRTSQPTPAEFAATYENLATKYETIISIHISSKMSGTIQSARMGAQMVPGADIVVIDSTYVSMGCGLIVLEAAKAAQAGKTKEEILSLIDQMISRMLVYFIPETLEYLEKGGRIGKAQAFAGTLLSIKPIVYISEGIIHPYEKVRGRKRAIERLVQVVSEKVGRKEVLCALPHGMDPEGVEELRKRVVTQLNVVAEPIVYVPGAIVGTHAGPGVLGLICCPE
jgi:DegV family protein with EDD domain